MTSHVMITLSHDIEKNMEDFRTIMLYNIVIIC